MSVAVNKERSAPTWLRCPEIGPTLAIRVIVWIALRLGRSAARVMLYPICAYFVLFSGRSRAASVAYLSRVLASRPRTADVMRHYLSFASCVLDRVFFLNDQAGLFDIVIHGEEVVSDILREGIGCLLLGAHHGSFEALRTVGRQQPDLRVGLVMYEENARKIGAVLNAINPALALDIIALGKASSMIEIKDRIGRGDFIGMLADRTLAEDEKVRLDFLAAPAAFPTGPFRMAALLKRPVVLMFGIYRGGRRYEIFFERLANSAEGSTGSDSAWQASLMRRYVGRLEYYCRLAPYNWFNFYDFWE
jgi:predicted LPLAT superfamily acyltransferase